MARPAIEKYAEVSPATRGVHGELRRLDPVHRFVAALLLGAFDRLLIYAAWRDKPPVHALPLADRR